MIHSKAHDAEGARLENRAAGGMAMWKMGHRAFLDYRAVSPWELELTSSKWSSTGPLCPGKGHGDILTASTARRAEY